MSKAEHGLAQGRQATGSRPAHYIEVNDNLFRLQGLRSVFQEFQRAIEEFLIVHFSFHRLLKSNPHEQRYKW
jgi:hypothetical protein